MERLNLQLLGPFQASRGNTPLEGFDSDKVRALLALLAVEASRPQPREKLAGLLWPDYPERSARTSLRRSLSNLCTVLNDRAAHPPYLLASRQTVQFNLESEHSLDVRDFERLVQSGAGLPQLETALSLYRGLFLEGFSLPDSAAFEEWLLLTWKNLGWQYPDGHTTHRALDTSPRRGIRAPHT